jgi:hypothetical protein
MLLGFSLSNEPGFERIGQGLSELSQFLQKSQFCKIHVFTHVPMCIHFQSFVVRQVESYGLSMYNGSALSMLETL